MRHHYSHIEAQMQADKMSVSIKVVFPLTFCPNEMNTLKSPLKGEVDRRLLKIH